MRTLPENGQSTLFDLLSANIRKRVQITDKEFKRATAFFTPKKIRKKQFLVQNGEVCNAIAFVTNGCLRSYTVDEHGEEHVLQFAIEDWWISDLHSFLTGRPSDSSIDALEDSEILLLERSSREELLEAIPKFERFFRLLLEGNYVATNQRIVCSMSASAEERYLSFLKAFPTMAQRVPQNQIASYLGIAPESLSRVRKHLATAHGR
jgi:CRP-like cAMP-binding protein